MLTPIRVAFLGPPSPVVDLAAPSLLDRADRSDQSLSPGTPSAGALSVGSQGVDESAVAPARTRRAVPEHVVQVGRRTVDLTHVQAIRLRRAVTVGYLDRVLRRGP